MENEALEIATSILVESRRQLAKNNSEEAFALLDIGYIVPDRGSVQAVVDCLNSIKFFCDKYPSSSSTPFLANLIERVSFGGMEVHDVC